MIFERFSPSEQRKNLVKEYWIYENDDPAIFQQKIIPDGYSEIIVHYGDPYRINLNGKWETQSPFLYSNQISSFFFLENTGKSGMIGIKLHPCAFYELFEVDQQQSTDLVLDLSQLVPNQVNLLNSLQSKEIQPHERVAMVERWLSALTINPQAKVRNAVDQILERQGIIGIDEMAAAEGLSTRQLERQFKKVIGLTPKFYSRIIRFSNIFQVMDSEDYSWVKVALQSGYFDQAHFIKNFKEFTGEEPSKYGFDEQNLANFFLKK